MKIEKMVNDMEAKVGMKKEEVKGLRTKMIEGTSGSASMRI